MFTTQGPLWRYNSAVTEQPDSAAFRYLNLLVALTCAALLGYAYWLQYTQFLDPCPLCIFQRGAFFALGLLTLAAALHNPGRRGRTIYALLGGFFAALGTAIAGRHVWLQNLPPDQVPECGPGLDYMLRAFPLSRAIRETLTGSGECASVDWTFAGLSMPWWTLFWFVTLGTLVLTIGLRRSSSRP